MAALAEQARVLSVGEMKDIAEPRRTAMTVCLLAQVQAAVRDETVVMLSKRMSRHLKRAQEELLEIEQRQKETTERLLATFRDVLTALRGSGEATPGAWEGEASLDDLLALKNARAAVETAGGFEAQLAEGPRTESGPALAKLDVRARSGCIKCSLANFSEKRASTQARNY